MRGRDGLRAASIAKSLLITAFESLIGDDSGQLRPCLALNARHGDLPEERNAMPKQAWFMVVTLVAAAASGCTGQQVYTSTTALRTHQCEAVPARDRADCLDKERTSYSDYKKARDEAKTADKP